MSEVPGKEGRGSRTQVTQKYTFPGPAPTEDVGVMLRDPHKQLSVVSVEVEAGQLLRCLEKRSEEELA